MGSSATALRGEYRELRCGALSTVTRLRLYLERLADLLSRIGVDSSELREAASKLRSLEKAFTVVKPFAQGVTEISSYVSSIESLVSSRREEVGSKLREIAGSINGLVVRTLRASSALRALLISVAIALAAASYALTQVPSPAGIKFLSTAMMMLTMAISAAVVVGSVLYLNTTLLFLPMLAALVSVQALIHTVTPPPDLAITLYLSAASAMASLALFSKIVSSSFSSYRRALIALIQIERSVESIAATLSRVELEKPTVEPALRESFRKHYGARGEELAKYIEEVSKLR